MRGNKPTRARPAAAGPCGFTLQPRLRRRATETRANGCEVDLARTPAHCGRCGAPARRASAPAAPPAARCDDRVRNGTETDVDCGGSCARCALCQSCTVGSDCASGTWAHGRRAAPSART
ncbi:MAG: hypothetical protein IPF99_24935 [Deltaproteobacteria bacterium]|nr:hypothetical protein [Deltaproteobacteria bacterium]